MSKLRTYTFTADEMADFLDYMAAKANHARGWSEKTRLMAVREFQGGIAQSADDICDHFKQMMAAREPRPALRLVEKDEVRA